MFPTVIQSHDDELRRRVIDFLVARGVAGWDRLGVQVAGGVVVVTGWLPSSRVKSLCLDYCRHVAGVIRVVDELEPGPDKEGKTPWDQAGPRAGAKPMIPYRVLVADPDERLLATYLRFFPKKYWEIAVATSGLECVTKLREFRPHVLVLEPVLPWGGGAGVLAQMHFESDVPLVPVLVLTGGRDAGAVKAVQKFPLADFARKPLNPHDLARRIRRVLVGFPAESSR